MRNWDEDFDDDFYYSEEDLLDEEFLDELELDFEDFDDLFSEESLRDYLESFGE